MATIDGRRRKSRIGFNKNFMMLLFSLALGAFAVYMAKDFIEDKIDYYKSQLEKTEEMVQVVVPKRNVSRGEIVSSQDFAMREIPLKYAHANAVTKSTFNVATGQRLSFDVAKGKALLWAHLEGGIMPTFSGKVPEGKRAMTVTVDKINSISGFLQPTDNIDLLLEYEKTIFPIIQNLHVLATGTRTRIDKTGRATGGTYNTITVEVTPEVAKKIALARSVGSLTAVLRSPKDDGPISKENMTIAQLLNKPKPKP
ncbi:MAG TPA: Flp pilus assembly protein CpaB, partial [Calditrichaeota bacterium]|nr:Flp pilus assembly protein CpaB [Calditrichota bacterium]